MNSEDLAAGASGTDPWLTDEIVSYTSEADLSLARGRRAKQAMEMPECGKHGKP